MSPLVWIVFSSLVMSAVALVGSLTLILKSRDPAAARITPGWVCRRLLNWRRLFSHDTRGHCRDWQQHRVLWSASRGVQQFLRPGAVPPLAPLPSRSQHLQESAELPDPHRRWVAQFYRRTGDCRHLSRGHSTWHHGMARCSRTQGAARTRGFRRVGVAGMGKAQGAPFQRPVRADVSIGRSVDLDPVLYHRRFVSHSLCCREFYLHRRRRPRAGSE